LTLTGKLRDTGVSSKQIFQQGRPGVVDSEYEQPGEAVRSQLGRVDDPLLHPESAARDAFSLLSVHAGSPEADPKLREPCRPSLQGEPQSIHAKTDGAVIGFDTGTVVRKVSPAPGVCLILLRPG
jgi:hypothetical protein